jgi:hypothetical protein
VKNDGKDVTCGKYADNYYLLYLRNININKIIDSVLGHSILYITKIYVSKLLPKWPLL